MVDEDNQQDSYMKLLRKAKELLPRGEERVRFEIPVAQVQQLGRQTQIKNFAQKIRFLKFQKALRLT